MGGLASSIGKLRGIGRAADPAFDRRIAALLLGSLVAGGAELLSIGGALPMLLLANGGRQVALGPFTQTIGGDIRTWAMVFAVLVALTAALRMWLAQFSQRQVLEIGSSVARALYKDAPFLLLDEATNALDDDTEKALLAALRKSRPTSTVVIVSHREAALAACDRIYRIEDGRATAR